MKVEILSPVHIGSGESYGKSEYIIKNKTISRIDLNKFFRILKESERDEFVEELEDPNFEIQRFIEERKIPIEDCILYELKTIVKNPIEIKEHIKTNLKPYLPGSSLKGAMRTAIIYHLFGKKEIKNLSNYLDDRIWRRRDKNIRTMIDKLMSGKTKQAPHSDLLKFFQISDSNPTKTMVNTVKSLEAHYSTYRWYRRGVSTFMECLMTGESLEVDAKITQNLMNDNVKGMINQRLGLEGKKEILSLERIKELIFEFSRNFIEHELEFSKRYSISFLKEFYEKIQNQNKPNSPLIKIGQGSGFLATTVNLKIKKDQELYKKVVSITRRKERLPEFPKTKKICVEENAPLGWVKLE